VRSSYDAYRSEGCTDVRPVLDDGDLEPIQGLIWDLTAHLLPGDARERPLKERLRMRFVREPTADAVARLMNTVNASAELRSLVTLPSVAARFADALGTDAIEPFPISRFRAQIPGLARSSFAWHQDEGTWYAVKFKSLAHRLPATLWLSLNGADSSDSIEFIPRSHEFGLAHHRHREGQGYFQALVPPEVERLERRHATARPGDGMFLHPLLFHRSIPSPPGPPRYSVDLRYCRREPETSTYRIDPRLRLRRWLTW
jgi:hypothetical protein